MVSLIATLSILTALLSAFATTSKDPHAIYTSPDSPNEQTIHALWASQKVVQDDEYEPIRKELIVDAATVVTRLTQQPRMFIDKCRDCPPSCPNGCPRGCCDWFNLAFEADKFLKRLIELWDELDSNKTEGFLAETGRSGGEI